MGWNSIKLIKPRTEQVVRAAAGESGGKSPEVPKKIAEPATEKGKVLEKRKTGGVESRLSKALVVGGDVNGRPRKNFFVPAGLTGNLAKKMYRVKGSVQKGNLKELIDYQRPDAAKQLVKLGDDIKKVAGTDKRSGRYALALLLAEAIGNNFTLQKIEQATTARGAEGIVPFLVHWTWLQSNGPYVLGDRYARIAQEMGVAMSIDSTKKEKADAGRGAKRKETYTKFEKEVLPELEAQILDKIGEELDQIARWARAKSHNEMVGIRVAALKQQKAKVPNDAQHSPIRGVNFPEKSFVEYLATELNLPELSKDSLLKKIGALPYIPYQVASKKRKEVLARDEKQKKAAEPVKLQSKSKEEIEKDKAIIHRQSELSPLLDVATQRRGKVEALAAALGKDVQGDLRNVQDRATGLTTAYKNFLEDAVQYMPPKDTRKWMAKAFIPKNFGDLQQTKLEGLKREAKDLETRWKRLEDFINNVVVAAVPKEVRSLIKLDAVRLDALDARNAPTIAGALKKAFGEIRRKDRPPQTPAEQEKFLQKVLPSEIQELGAKMRTLREALNKSYTERELLKKDPQTNILRLTALEKEISAGAAELQSLNSTIQNLKWLVNPKDPTVKIKMDPKLREQRFKRAANVYWSRGKR